MAELRETCVNHIDGDQTVTFSSSATKWINRITKLHEQYPDDVNIIHTPENNHGTIYAELPQKWLKVSPPRQMNYTDEQRAAMAERLSAAREKRDK